MLNELLLAKRGAEQAGLELIVRHPDIKDSRNIPTIIVSLDSQGLVDEVRAKAEEISPWTLSDGNHNSFPFVQIKTPLMTHSFPADDELIESVLNRRSETRRADFMKWLAKSAFEENAFDDWPGTKLVQRISDRLELTKELLKNKRAVVVPKTMECFLAAIESVGGTMLLQSISNAVVQEVKKSPESTFLDAAVNLFLGKFNAKSLTWENTAGLVFEAAGCKHSIISSKLIVPLSKCLNDHESKSTDRELGVCRLTGGEVAVIDDKYPQPNVPVLGQTYLFSRNSASKSNTRYGRTSVDAMPIGVDVANELAAAFSSLTSDQRQNITWRPIPGEAPKQTDLLLAYVKSAPDAAVAGMIANESDGDFEDASEDSEQNSIAEFQLRTERVVDAVKARVDANFLETPVTLNVFRKVDPANRKVVYGTSLTIGDLYKAATEWVEGEENVPPELKIVAKPAKGKAVQLSPPHVAPLGLIAFSKKLFQRDGMEAQEVAGVPASEAMSIFMRLSNDTRSAHGLSVLRLLRLVLRRRMQLCGCAVHLLRRSDLRMVNQHNREALRTVSILGILLHKLGRKKEQYMNETAYKLGQLLAAADVVHAGYCADVRGGAVPPSLLGNQILSMAQSAPAKALAVWCRRWKPYDGWARRMQHSAKEQERVAQMKSKGKLTQRGWDIKKAIRNWRELKPLAESLKGCLDDCAVDEKFRAELLLGYMAGIPDAKRPSAEESSE